MTSLSDDNQADIIEAFNSTSRYLDDLLIIDNPYFEGMVNKIYPPELQLNKAEDIYTAAGWNQMYQNRYLHGSRSRGSAKSAIYTAAGCQHKIAIYTAAVPKSIQIYTRLPCVHIKSLFTRQQFKSQIGYIHCCRVYT